MQMCHVAIGAKADAVGVDHIRHRVLRTEVVIGITQPGDDVFEIADVSAVEWLKQFGSDESRKHRVGEPEHEIGFDRARSHLAERNLLGVVDADGHLHAKRGFECRNRLGVEIVGVVVDLQSARLKWQAIVDRFTNRGQRHRRIGCADHQLGGGFVAATTCGKQVGERDAATTDDERTTDEFSSRKSARHGVRDSPSCQVWHIARDRGVRPPR